tara:strand:+ start:263 stop:1141 length:879 start_codon:yes stop_codon:yes gene_type:complete
LARPLFVIDMSRILGRQAHFVTEEQVLLIGRSRRVQLYSLAARVPDALGPSWDLPSVGQGSKLAGEGARLVVVAQDRAWTLTLPSKEGTELPRLPFAPHSISLWTHEEKTYLAVVSDDRVAVGELGAPLGELSCKDYSLKDVAGGGRRVAAIARLPNRTPGILVFDLDGSEPAFYAFPTRPTALVLGPGGERGAFGSRSGLLQVRAGPRFAEVTRSGVGHGGSIRSLDWRGGLLAVVSKFSVSVWREDELRVPWLRGSLQGDFKADEVYLSPSGERLLVRRRTDFLGWHLGR